MKTCNSCQQNLPLADFYLRSSGKVETRCKKCFVAAQAAGIKRRQDNNIANGDRLRASGQSKQCANCQESKPYTQFNRAKKNPDGHAHKCTACSRPYAKRYYEANRERVKDSQTASLEESIRVKREYLIEHYKRNPCVDCGTDNVLVLQSDHQSDKKYEISRLINSGYSLQVLVDELNKCVTRCANCHQIITAKAFKFWRLEYVWFLHGCI